MENKLTRVELIALVTKICEADGTEEQINEMLAELRRQVADPSVTDYIFHTDSILTPQEIVDKALSYKPIQL